MHPLYFGLVFEVKSLNNKGMKKVYVFVIIGSLLVVFSCYHMFPCIDGVGDTIEETRDVTDFYSVSNTTSMDVFVTQADSFSVRVIAQENLIPLLETYRSGSTLLVKTREFSCIRSTNDIEIHITMPEIEELNLTGSGMIQCEFLTGNQVELSVTSSGIMNVDTLLVDELKLRNSASGHMNIEYIETDFAELRMSGSGEIDFGESYLNEIDVRHSSSGTIRGGVNEALITDLTMSGSGRIILHGDSEDLTTSHSSSGRMDALDLECVDVRTHSSGSGNTYVNAEGILEVTILGSGDVIYAGTPSETIFRITGSGNVRSY